RRTAGLLLAKPGIAEAVAADAGGRRLALLHGVIAAAGHVAGDVLPAKFAGGGATGGHRTKNGGGGNGRRRHAQSQKQVHRLLSEFSCRPTRRAHVRRGRIAQRSSSVVELMTII